MYRVTGIKEYAATRDVLLLNEETGTKETCFDDSALMGYENFSFMKDVYKRQGTGGWGSSPNAKVNFGGATESPSGNQWSGVITLNISSYQGTYRIHLGQYLQGATWKDPYKAWRNNYVKKIYMYA